MQEKQSKNEPQVIVRTSGKVKAMAIPRFKIGVQDLFVGGGMGIITFILFMTFGEGWVKVVGLPISIISGCGMLIGTENHRVYNHIYRIMIFIANKKTFAGKDKNLLMPWREISSSYISYKDGTSVGVMKVFGKDIENLLDSDQYTFFSNYSDFLKNTESLFYINKVDNVFDTMKQIASIDEKLAKASGVRKKILEDDKAILEHIGGDDNNLSMYYILVKGQSIEELDREINVFENGLMSAGLTTVRVEGKKLYNYAMKSIFPLTKHKLYDKVSKDGVIRGTDIIPFDSVRVGAKMINIDKGQRFMKVMQVTRFPSESSMSWLSALFDIPNTNVYMQQYKVRETEAIRRMDKAYQEMRMRGLGEGASEKISDVTEQTLVIENIEQFMSIIKGNNESLYQVNLLVLVHGSTKHELRENIKIIHRTANRSRLRISELPFQQLQGFLECHNQIGGGDFINQNRLDLGTLGLAHAWPFVSESFNDSTGFYIGYSEGGKPVIIDWGKRDASIDRVQNNSIVFGKTGNGKTTHIKNKIKNLYANKFKQHILDPENEYFKLSKGLGGKFIDLSGNSEMVDEKGAKYTPRLNPLQPFITNAVQLDGDDGDLVQNISPINYHLQFLEQWFKTLLFPNVIDIERQMNYLTYAVANMYDKAKITNLNISQKEAKDFPTLSDLHAELMKLSESKSERHYKNNEIFQILAERLIAYTHHGNYGNLWDGVTTLNVVEDDIVVYNIQSLKSSGNVKLIQSQLHLITKYMESIVEHNRILSDNGQLTKTSIIIDEAHLLVNKRNPIPLLFIAGMYKRIRKYEGQITLVTQNIGDFTASEEIRTETGGILNAVAHMIVFGLEAADIADLDNLKKESGGLTSKEKAFLNLGKLHQAIFISKNYRSVVSFEYSDVSEELWGYRKKVANA